MVLASPGDRRDEDIHAIARAAAGKFDHYICRRDDNTRGRGPEEVPRMQAATLEAVGVPATAISIIPDEQEAIDAALRMGQTGDLILIFADVLARSWKQIIKFRPEAGADAPPRTRAATEPPPSLPPPPTPTEAMSLEGLIRDERGIRFAPEAED